MDKINSHFNNQELSFEKELYEEKVKNTFNQIGF